MGLTVNRKNFYQASELDVDHVVPLRIGKVVQTNGVKPVVLPSAMTCTTSGQLKPHYTGLKVTNQ